MFRSLLIVLLAAAVCSAGVAPALRSIRRPRLDGRIVGGTEVDITEYPYQLYFLYEGLIFASACGASIISNDWALTAAHCVVDSALNGITLRSGSSLSNSGGTVHTVSDGYYHAQYDDSTLDNDIGVLQVANAFTFSDTTAAIGLATSDPADGTEVTVSGWGTTSEDSNTTPEQLRAVTVNIINRDECNTAYALYGGITNTQICAGVTGGGRDSCSGDSGGPLVSGSSQVGIVSWGVGCAESAYPGVYSSIASLRSWISEVTGV